VHAEYEDRALDDLGLDPVAAAHYGTTVAILAGDLQQSWSYALLADLVDRGVSHTLVLELIQRMATSLTPQLLEGEMLDVQFSLPGAPTPSERDVVHMLGKKTAALLEYTAWAGARIGLGAKSDPHGYAEAIASFARSCGIAFQLQDDLLGLTADESLLGKPVGSDLREGKHTYLVSRALACGNNKQRNKLTEVLGHSHATTAQVNAAVEVIRDTGAFHEAEGLANSYINQGLEQLSKLPASKERDLLRTWALYLLARKH
jgi:geranylgeranyl diphosphate synthase type I